MKKINLTPMDLAKKPIKEKWFITPLKWLLALPTTFSRGLKVNKVNMEGLKGPYLLLATHHSFIDFKVQTQAIFPRSATYVVAVDGFIGKEWLLRNVGGIPKRKFTPHDMMLFKHLKYSLEKLKVITTIYAESAYSISGTTSPLPDSLAKVVKVLNHPVVVLNMHGNFLTEPNYLRPKPRKIKLKADLTQVITKEQLSELSVEEIRTRINNAYQYDEWQYQYDNKIEIKDKNRADHLNRILYQCQNCLTEHKMVGSGTQIKCLECGETHELSIYGKLQNVNGVTKYDHVPNWFEKQREFVKQEVLDGKYFFEDEVYIDSLRNANGFVRLPDGKLRHDINGFHLTGMDFEGPLDLKRESSSMYTVHIEFNFKKSDKTFGDAIVLSTDNDTYYCYPKNAKDIITKVRFATEEIHKIVMNKSN